MSAFSSSTESAKAFKRITVNVFEKQAYIRIAHFKA